MPIKVFIVDDQRLMREGLKTLIELEEGLEVVGMAENGEIALETISADPPDVVLMDIRMPVMNGVECTKIVRQRFPTVKVLILTTFDDDEYIIECLKYGAHGYLLKDLSADKLISSIKDVYLGNSILQPEIASKIISHVVDTNSLVKKATNLKAEVKNDDDIIELSEREKEILRYMSRGMTNREISNTLFITEGTVKNYITGIYSKIGINDRTKAIIYATEKKYI